MNAGNFCHPENPGSTHWSGCECHEARWTERLAAAEARIRELEGAARAVLADHAERLEAYGEENEGQPYRVKVMADLCTALNPPPGDEKKGGEKP